MASDETIRSTSFLLKGGKIINADGSLQADVAVSGNRIVAIGKLDASEFPGYDTVDASGKYIFPGGIDPHVHLALPTLAGCSSDDFYSGSKAALAGGTTSIIDFVTPKRGQSLPEALHLRRKEASASSCCWKLHMGISEWNERVKQEVIHCIRKEGIHSFKAYLAYRESIGISAADLLDLMMVIAGEGGILLVHCEDNAPIQKLREQFIREGKTHSAYHALSRPPAAEINAIREVIRLSSITGCSTYIVHISTGEGARLIREAKNAGIRVYAETCIQYLVLDDSVYDPNLPNEKVLPYVISPPIRSKIDQEILWEEVMAGTFDTLSTDHCPFNLRGQKDIGLNDFSKIPNGAGSIEYRMSLLFSEGVQTGRISLEQFVALTSANAAALFNWSGQKGKIAVGYDADLILWDPTHTWTIRQEEQYQQCDSNLYVGIQVKGKIDRCMMSGVVINLSKD